MPASDRQTAAASPTRRGMSPTRRSVALSCLGLAAWQSGKAFAQALSSDVIGGTVIKIDGERGTVTLRHAPITHLHLPATTTTFRYFNPSLVLRIKVGDGVAFRADRYDGSLRVIAIFPAGSGAPR